MRKPTTPQEIEAWYIIPAIRKGFVRGLIKQGLSQKDIAKKLGLSSAAVSQYLSGKRGKGVRFSRAIKSEIDKSVNILLNGGNAMKELQRICRLAEKELVVCRLSKSLGCKPKNCRVCFE